MATLQATLPATTPQCVCVCVCALWMSIMQHDATFPINLHFWRKAKFLKSFPPPKPVELEESSPVQTQREHELESRTGQRRNPAGDDF